MVQPGKVDAQIFIGNAHQPCDPMADYRIGELHNPINRFHPLYRSTASAFSPAGLVKLIIQALGHCCLQSSIISNKIGIVRNALNSPLDRWSPVPARRSEAGSFHPDPAPSAVRRETASSQNQHLSALPSDSVSHEFQSELLLFLPCVWLTPQ